MTMPSNYAATALFPSRTVPAFTPTAVSSAPTAAPLSTACEPWQLARSDVHEVRGPDGHPYRLMTSWPEGEPPAEGWPVLWLLDGEDNFAVATMTARRLARAQAVSAGGEGVIVAIEPGHPTRRVEDYTPSCPGCAIPRGFPAAGMRTGGADRFLDFMDRGFRPLLARRRHINPLRQTLAGHGFGGLLALYAMFTGRFFNGIVAVNPSLWYGGGVLENAERSADPALKTHLLLTGSPDEPGPDGRGGAAGEALTARWQRRGAKAHYVQLPALGHGSTMLAAMGTAITAAFA